MSRRNGPKIATVQPALTFKCLSCRFPILRRLDFCPVGHGHMAKESACERCGRIYDAHELDGLFIAHIMHPCSGFDCPYCHTHGMVFSTPDVQKSEDSLFGIGRRTYSWDLPNFVICRACNKPVKLDSKAAVASIYEPLHIPHGASHVQIVEVDEVADLFGDFDLN